MRLLGIMELRLASSFLPLLLLVWLPAGTASQTTKLVITVQCYVGIWPRNVTLFVVYKGKGQEVENQTDILAPGENCTNNSLCMHADCVENYELEVLIRRINSTGAANGIQRALLTCCLVGLQTNVTEEKVWTGPNLLCILFGLSAGTLIYTPVIGFLLWQCRRNRTGKLTSREVAEGNQLSTAAPVTGTEDLTYANLNFKERTKPASSNTIYTEIKPSQQQQSGGDASAANTEVDVYPKGEGK